MEFSEGFSNFYPIPAMTVKIIQRCTNLIIINLFKFGPEHSPSKMIGMDEEKSNILQWKHAVISSILNGFKLGLLYQWLFWFLKAEINSKKQFPGLAPLAFQLVKLNTGLIHKLLKVFFSHSIVSNVI